ncbi:MAG: LysR family transcriptional regulator, partial [Deltaproteobacteria bacterium]|nr:LysR family transcriptional regulator [Deltaproteobacteria bacterium]
MEWQQIIGFYYVAKLGSFTKAADATFRTQSALSQQVKNLEQELGCRLLERIGRRKLRLTSAGQRFFKFSETSLKRYQSLTEELNELKGLQKGLLRMAAPFTTLYHLVPFALKTYITQFPNVELTILDRSQTHILELVKNGDIDFGLVLESNVPKDLTSLRWNKVRTVLMTPLGHALAEAKRITLKQIGKYPLILPPINLKYRSNLEERFQKLGIDCHVIMESSNVELSSLYVEMGLGISFATIVTDLPELKKRKLAFLSMDHLFKPDYIAVVMRKDKTLVSYKKAFIKILFGETPANNAA